MMLSTGDWMFFVGASQVVGAEKMYLYFIAN